MRRRWLALAAAAALLALGGCTATKGPLWTPDQPRNGATQPVDPIYGTPIPGYPYIDGGG
jgi:predicted small lipoprotein YifL